MKYHLELYRDDRLIFSSNGRWIYPLFDLEEFITKENIALEGLILKDKIAGRAAAFLMCHMGIKRVHIGLLSQVGKDVFHSFGVKVTWDQLTDRIKCRTESLLEDITDIKEAYIILKKRAGLFSGIEIECVNLCCGYDNSRVLDGIDMNIPEGGTFLILGENGEGKTTFLKTIANSQPKISGNILFKKKGEIIKLGRGQIGLLSQNPNLGRMPILVKELMEVTASLLGLKSGEKEYAIEISLRRTGALDFYNRLFYELSGGERQRVNLARLICQRAGLFLLDEPASHLDKKGLFTLIDLLNDIHEREMPTILVASHNEEFIKGLGWNKLYIKDGGINYGSN